MERRLFFCIGTRSKVGRNVAAAWLHSEVPTMILLLGRGFGDITGWGGGVFRGKLKGRPLALINYIYIYIYIYV